MSCLVLVSSVSVLRPYLELVRPANVATSLADVLAGYAVAGLAAPRALPWLLLSTACLYAGGIVLNDFFDRKLDAVERPERPIPSGRVRAGQAAALGAVLLAAGLVAAHLASREAGPVSAAIVAAVLLYDSWGKRQRLLGPVNMGLCRGLNLCLGMAAVPGTVAAHWPVAILPLAYIAGVTMVSRGEVSGGRRGVALTALVLVAVVLVALGGISAFARGSVIWPFVLLGVLSWRVVGAFWKAFASPSPPVIRAAVRTGVLSLVLVDAVIAAAYADMIYSLAVLLTALLAGWLARQFAVT